MILQRYFVVGGIEGKIFLALVAGICLLIVGLNMFVPETSAFHVPTYVVALMGKYLCYATLALALDLVWGYCGILSLGHGAFFALGGYAMGMYLMRQIGTRGVYGNPELPDFMVFLNWSELPWYWYGFDWFPVCVFHDAIHAGSACFCLRLADIPLTRDGGLFFDHVPGHDLCHDAGLLPQ